MMKRFDLFIILIVMLTFLLSGCSKTNNSNDILICGFSDSVPEINLTLEYSKWNEGAYIDLEQPKTASVKIHEVTYPGKYVETELAFGSYELRHSYQDENKKYFELDSDGNLTAYFWGSSDAAGQAKPIDECEKIACDFISEISDVSLADYKKEVSYDNERKLYTISFIKYIGEIQSEDQAIVVMEETGDLYSFRFNMLGKITVSNIPDFDLDKIQNKLTAKLDLLTNNARKAYDSVEYKDFTYSISMDTPSAYILLCAVDVKCSKRQGEYDVVTTEKIQFVIPLS